MWAIYYRVWGSILDSSQTQILRGCFINILVCGSPKIDAFCNEESAIHITALILLSLKSAKRKPSLTTGYLGLNGMDAISINHEDICLLCGCA